MAAPQRNRLGEILVKAKVIDDLQLRSALAHVDQWGGRFTAAIVDLNLADEERATEAIASALGLQRVRLGNVQKDAAALARVDVQFAEANAVFPLALKDNGKTIHLALTDPTNIGLLDELGRKTRARVVPYLASETEIAHAIMRHYRNMEPPAADKIRRPPRSQENAGDEEEEFKITDMNGKTVMKRLADIDPALAAQVGENRSAPPVPSGAAGDLLDDLLGSAPVAAAQLSDADMQRIQSLRTNQEKSGVILRALTELLREKGMLGR